MKKYPYLYSISATLICLINVALALLSLAFLFRMIFTFGTFIGTLIRSYQVSNFTTFQKELLEIMNNIPLTSDSRKILQDIITSLKYDYLQLGITTAIMIFIFLISPLLVILNGTGSFSLRFGRRGSQMLRGVHIVYAVFCVIYILSVISAAVLCFLYKKEIAVYFGVTRGVPVLLYVVLIAITLITLIFLLLDFCYHKDIASHMFYITADRNKAPIMFKKNHLSGISVIFALLYLAAFGLSIYYSGIPKELPFISSEGFLLVMGIKYLCVMAANHRLKVCISKKNTPLGYSSL